MKTLVTNYTFTPNTKRISFNDYTNINLEQLLLITNVTSGIIIYNFAKPELGAVKFNANTITLDYNTASMNANDRLQIFIEAPAEVLTTRTPVISSGYTFNINTLFSVNGFSAYGQEQYLQIRNGSTLATSSLLYTGLLKPYENFNFNFNKGLTISSGVVHIVNSSTPTIVDSNNNNLSFTIAYTK